MNRRSGIRYGVRLAVMLGMLLSAAGIAGEARAEPVTLGVMLPLTGDYAEHGRSILTGVEVRTNEINAAGGIAGHPLRLRVLDTRSAAEALAPEVRELADDPEVLLILGPVTSAGAKIMGDAAREREIVVLAPVATQDGITHGNPWLFRAIFTNGFEGAAMARFLTETRGFSRFALFTDERHTYAANLSDQFREALLAAGATVVADLTFADGADEGRTDYRPALRRIREAEPDAVFIPAYGEEVQVIVRQAGEAGLEAVLCGGDSWDLDTVFLGSGRRLEGSLFIASFDLEEDTPQVANFVEKMKQAGLERADGNAAPGYDSVTVAALAVERAGWPATRDGVREALHTLRDVELVTGRLSITPDGDALKSLHIMEVVRNDDGNLTSKSVLRLDP